MANSTPKSQPGTRFQGKSAIVFGGSGGMGGNAAVIMAREGADVSITYRADASRAEAVAARVAQTGRRCLVNQVSLTDRTSIKNTIQKTIDAFGKVDVVACAVLDPSHRIIPLVEMTDESIATAINHLLWGHINICREIVPHMMQRKYGKIVIVTSDSGKVGTLGETISSACHGGLNSFCKSLARELARYNINVNAVAPGPTNTPLLTRMLPQDADLGKRATDRMVQLVPFKRLGRPEEIGEVIAFLASDAASWVTGQVISASGGLTMC